MNVKRLLTTALATGLWQAREASAWTSDTTPATPAPCETATTHNSGSTNNPPPGMVQTTDEVPPISNRAKGVVTPNGLKVYTDYVGNSITVLANGVAVTDGVGTPSIDPCVPGITTPDGTKVCAGPYAGNVVRYKSNGNETDVYSSSNIANVNGTPYSCYDDVCYVPNPNASASPSAQNDSCKTPQSSHTSWPQSGSGNTHTSDAWALRAPNVFSQLTNLARSATDAISMYVPDRSTLSHVLSR